MSVFDIRDARRALASHSELSLRHQRSLYDDAAPWKEDDGDDPKGLVFTDNTKKLQRYNAEDCVGTQRIKRKIVAEPEWNSPRVQRLYEVHTGLSKLAAKMHLRGFYVDQAKRKSLAVELETLHEARRKELYACVNAKAFTGTPDQMRSIIYERHKVKGIPCFGFADPDDPKMYTDETMTKCKVDKRALLMTVTSPSCPTELKNIIKRYWHFHAPRKARNTYVVSKSVDEAMGSDGAMHPEWNSCGTETMRWSCRRPNLMNLSEKKEGDILRGDLPNVRSMYRARPRYVIVHADFSQQELRVMEMVADDEALLVALQTGDVYSYDAKEWYGLEENYEVIKATLKEIRKSCKVIHLASQYGAGLFARHAQALQQDLDFQYEVTRRLARSFERVYHRTVSYWDEEHKRVLECGYSEGRLLGGRLQYPAPPDRTKTSNFPIQRTAGELTAIAMLKLEEKFKALRLDAHFVSIQHDAFDVEVREKQAPHVVAAMEDIMPGPWTFSGKTRPFPIEVKVAETWDKC